MSGDRLDTVVRIRALQERIARGGVERARRSVVEREREVSDAADAVSTRADRAPERPGSYAAQRDMLAVGSRDVAVAELHLDQAHLGVEDALNDWTDASRRLEGVERLEIRLAEVRRHDELVAAQVELDDLVVMRWNRRAS